MKNGKRLAKITHDTLHYLANIYKIVSKAQSEVDDVCKKLLLNEQEVEDLKGDEDE